VTAPETRRNEAARCRGRLSGKAMMRKLSRIPIIRPVDSASAFNELGAVSEGPLSKTNK